MEKKDRNIVQSCGCELARPYINNQVLTKMYNFSSALQNGTIFPELFLLDSSMYNANSYKNPKNRVRGKK